MIHLPALLQDHYRKPRGGMKTIAAVLGRPVDACHALLKGFRWSHGKKLPPSWRDAALAVLRPDVWDPSLPRRDVAEAFLLDTFGDRPPEFWRDLGAACRKLRAATQDADDIVVDDTCDTCDACGQRHGADDPECPG